MLNYGFNNTVGAASHPSGDAWQARSEKNKDGDHTRFAQFGLSGCGDLQGNDARRDEEIQVSESDSLDNREERWEPEVQFLEIRDGFKIRQTTFWLDVIPGI